MFDRCVGVMQNDRVEIIANDRKYQTIYNGVPWMLFSCQRVIGPLLHMSPSLVRSV